MPCHEPLDGPSYEFQAEFRHNSDVAALLCEAMKLIENHKEWDNSIKSYYRLIQKCSPELLVWWEEHKLRDKLKIGKEKR